MSNINFWDSDAWSILLIFSLLLGSLLTANILKKTIPYLQKTLIPTSVLGGSILMIIAAVYKLIMKEGLFDSTLFGVGSTGEPVGRANLELIIYHSLALGFIASSLKTTKSKLNKHRATEVFNTGLTTVATYLLQGFVGIGITVIVALFIPGFFKAAGMLLPFGFGQGTGQALNYGSMYEKMEVGGFPGGTNFGITIAALGFLSASIGGVIHLNYLKRRGRLVTANHEDFIHTSEEIESPNEIPMQESCDKMTIQIAIIGVAYFLTYAAMWGLGLLIPGMKSTIYGFNFLIGVIAASLVKFVMNTLKRVNIIKKEYTNNFLLTRISNLFFDIMVVAGVAAIDLGALQEYWGVVIILAVVGLVITYVYNRFVAKKLFRRYSEEQFLMMYGMLTGTASTGTILLREIDGNFKTPAADNMIYQNLPAIAFGFPLMLIAGVNFAPVKPGLACIVMAIAFVAINFLLFRSLIFKKKIRHRRKKK